jgi:hypothetical protein
MDLGLDRHYKDFAPRLGIAYRLSEKTVIRTGFGISYAPFPDNTYAYNFPVKQNNAYEPNCSICPAVLPNGQIASFQAGFPTATPAVIPPNGIIVNPDPSQVYFQVNPHFREPYVESWNLAIQRTLPSNFVLDLQPERLYHDWGRCPGPARVSVLRPQGEYGTTVCRLQLDVQRAATEAR